METVFFYRNNVALLYGLDFEIEVGSLFRLQDDVLYLISDDDYADFEFNEEDFDFYAKTEIAIKDTNR